LHYFYESGGSGGIFSMIYAVRTI